MRWRTLLALIVCSVSVPGFGESADEKGRAIAVEAERRDSGWTDQKSTMRMILRNRQGQESVRELRVRTRERPKDGDHSLTIFDSPRDIKGTALLSYTHALQPDDQWLYLPALKRVKRIASANKSGPFMGSEFAYEDLTSQEVAKYSYTWLRDETLDGRETFVVERIPAYEYSGYTRQIAWIDKEMYRPLKIEYYDRKNAPLKTLTLSDYRQYRGRYWRSHAMHMVNHQTGKETDLLFGEYQFDNGYDDRDFSRTALKRVR